MTTTGLIAVVLVLIAAAVEALSNVLQHKATNEVTASGTGEAGAVVRTMGKPLFLLGFGEKVTARIEQVAPGTVQVRLSDRKSVV